MLKSILLMLPALMLFSSGSSLQNEERIKVNQNFPETIKAGEEFVVTIEIHKSEISGFARIQQFLPDGFNVEEIDSKGADFLFENNSVKFIWVKLPVESVFNISYKIKTESYITGKQTIKGEFVYQNKGKTEHLVFQPVEMNVGNETRSRASVSPAATPQVVRRLLSIAPEKGEYQVEITVRPNSVTESAQFSDDIPAEFTAELIEAHEADFSFVNHAVLFTWKNLPIEEVFTISYRVKSSNPSASPVINGVFSYGDITVNQPTPKEIPVGIDLANIETKKADEIIPPPAEVIKEDKTLMADNKNQISHPQKLSVPEKGITFKVQVSATQKSSVKNKSWFDSKFQLNENVELTYHEGWKKYLVGSFHGYNDASTYRKKTQGKIPDAFIVAYENGMRIPVSEAMKNKSLNQ